VQFHHQLLVRAYWVVRPTTPTLETLGRLSLGRNTRANLLQRSGTAQMRGGGGGSEYNQPMSLRLRTLLKSRLRTLLRAFLLLALSAPWWGGANWTQ